MGDKETILQDLNLWLAQEEDILYASFRFYREEDALYSSSGIYTNLAYFQDMWPDVVQYRFFSGREGFSSVEFGGQTYLLYCVPIRDVPGGAAKGEMNLLFDSRAIGRRLSHVTEGKFVRFSLVAADGTPLWSCSTGEERDTVPLSTPSFCDAYQYEVDVPASLHSRTSGGILPYFLLTDGVSMLVCVLAALVLAALGYHPIHTMVQRFAGDSRILSGPTRSFITPAPLRLSMEICFPRCFAAPRAWEFPLRTAFLPWVSPPSFGKSGIV